MFHIRIYFIIRAKIRFYFETNKKNHKKLRKNCDNCDRDRNGKKTTLVLPHKKNAISNFFCNFSQNSLAGLQIKP